MNCFYHKLKQNNVLRLFLLAIVGILASSASAGTIDLGALELDKVYNVSNDFNDYTGTFTPTKSGVLTLHRSAANINIYSDAAHENMFEMAYNNYDTEGYQVYSMSVEAGETYYLYLNFSMDSGKFKLTMDDGLIIKNNTLPDGSEISAGGRASAEIIFNQAVTYDEVHLISGTHDTTLSADKEEVRVSNGTLMIEYGSTLTSWYESGYVKAGDKVTIKVTGLRSSVDEKVLYNKTGVLELTYTALGKPVTLESAGTANGEYKLQNTIQTSATFLSYFEPGDENGIYVFNFSEPLDPTKGSFTLQFGSQEALDYCEEALTPVFSNDNKTVTLDVTGKVRTNATLGLQYSLEKSYGYIVLALNNITAADGQYVYTGVSGSIGSFNFPITYKEVKSDVSADFTPAAEFGTASQIEIYVDGYDQIKFDGVQFAWTKNREQQTVVVPASELKIESYEEANQASVLVTIPESVKSLNNVTVSFYNLKTSDGVDHSKALSKVFNYVAPKTAENFTFTSTPAAGETVEKCTEMVLTFPGYEKVLCKEAAAYLTGRATTGYSYLEVAIAGTTGNQLVQPFGSATANNDHYTVTFPEGYFELDDDVVNPAFNVIFAVYKETSSTDGVSYSTTPADGETVESCDEIKITFNDYSEAGPSWNYKATLAKKGSDTVITLGDPGYGDAYNEVIQPLGGNASTPGAYTVTFPEGFFNLGETDLSPEISVSFIIEGTEEPEQPTTLNVESNPANGATVESCTEIELTFPDYATVAEGSGKATIIRRGDYEFVELGSTEWGVELNQIVQPLGNAAAEDGVYTVTFPAGYFLLGTSEDDFDPSESTEFSIVFEVKANGGSTGDLNITSTPANGATVASCEEIDIIFNDYDEAGIGGGKATLAKEGGETVELGDAEYGVAWNEVLQPLGSALEDGKYTATFPAGYFILDGDDCPEFTITFTVDKTGGINDITVNGENDVQYFDLKGVKVNNPANGLFIVKRGNTISKQVVK